jgi:uncharacterized membrane protein (UPF0127 family)
MNLTGPVSMPPNQSMKIIFLLLIPALTFALEFKSKIIHVGSQKLKVELAESEEQQERGLMFRRSIKDGEGMLFVFQEAKPRRFWMKNTFVNLSIGYFDEQKILIDIQDMKAVTSELEQNPQTYPSARPAKYALEVPLGWFLRNKLKKGEKLVLE